MVEIGREGETSSNMAGLTEEFLGEGFQRGECVHMYFLKYM